MCRTSLRRRATPAPRRSAARRSASTSTSRTPTPPSSAPSPPAPPPAARREPVLRRSLGLLIALVVQATLGAGGQSVHPHAKVGRGSRGPRSVRESDLGRRPGARPPCRPRCPRYLGSIGAVVRAVRAQNLPAIMACTAGFACLLEALAAGAAF